MYLIIGNCGILKVLFLSDKEIKGVIIDEKDSNTFNVFNDNL